MKKIIYPEKKDWMEILRRPVLNTDTLRNTVKEVLDKVKTEGDKAVPPDWFRPVVPGTDDR